MESNGAVRKPVFELGLKSYKYGKEALQLARAAQGIGKHHDVTIVFTPQLVDVQAVAAAAPGVLVFAPHLDSVPIGKGSGSILAEAVKAAGAAGVFLNHAEKPITLTEIARSVQRAKEVGLLTMVAVASPSEAAAVACFEPDMIVAEPPKLIGGLKSVSSAMPEFIKEAVAAIRSVNPAILVLCGAGIRNADDAAAVIRAGADGTGSTTGVLLADDPIRTLDEMVDAVKNTWEEMHHGIKKNAYQRVSQ